MNTIKIMVALWLVGAACQPFAARGAANTAPAFPAALNRFVINGGDAISITNLATDTDSPPQTLTYSLPVAPAGATLNTNTGTVNWLTTTNHAGTSNFFQVVVTDNGAPPLSATNGFTVFVRSLKPNVVLIVTDDQGYHDLGAHGAECQTPNMDRLGSEGVRLERFYATPVCAVTRSTLLTGRTTLRTSASNARGLDLREHLMPVTFKAAGYQAFMVGKWHLGGFYNNTTNVVINGATNPVVRENVDYEPQVRGWDYHYGQYGGAIDYLSHLSQEPGFNAQIDWWLNGQTNFDAGWSGDLEASNAMAVIKSRDPSKPMLLYFALNAVHPGVSAPTNYLAKYTNVADVIRRTMDAALDQLDVNIGQVLTTLDAEGITTNTLVVYFSDNGADTNSGGLNVPLRGTKGDYFDGSIHLPAAVRWPGVIPAGVTNCQQFVSVADLFPTICAATGVTPLNVKPFDGTNVWPLLLGATNGPFNPAHYRGAPLFSSSASQAPGAAVLDVFSNGASPTMFKLIHYQTAGVFTNLLFDVISDPYETTDVSANPAYTNVMTALINDYNAAAIGEKYGPYLGVQPQSQSVALGGNATLFAMTSVYALPMGVQWRKNGTNVLGATNYAAVDQGVYLTALNLTNVTSADAAGYDVVVTNAASGWSNSIASSLAVLTVLGSASNTAPVFNSTPTNYAVLAGNTLLATNAATDAQSPPQTLVYRLLDGPGGALIDTNTGVVSWTTSTNNAGTVGNFSVVVTDNGTPPLSATNGFTVTVLTAGSSTLVVTNTVRSPLAPNQASVVTVRSTVTGPTNVSGVTLYYAVAGVTNAVTMYDDGLHNDGLAGDGAYGGTIPNQAAGAVVSYFVRARDAALNVAADPAAGSYNYTVTNSGTGWSMLRLPDTGQTNAYTTVFGEDSDYLTNAPSFTDNGNGTILDNVTGLIWQKTDSAEMAWSNAVTYAATNTLGGATTNAWRLPTAHELNSILNFGLNPPVFDPNYFNLTASGNTNFWWTADARFGDATIVWSASAGGAMTARPKADTLSAGGLNSYHARLVRGTAGPTISPLHTYATNGDGTVTDADTGLMWVQGEVATALDWTNALIYAEALTNAGYGDWRLPNVRELRSLNDETLASPSVNATVFASNRVAHYWSSTTQPNRTTNAWYVDFQFGFTGQDPKVTSNWVRCVRGPVSAKLANTAPVLAAIGNRTVNAGATVVITNAASDAETPTANLTFALLTTVTNATVNATNGIFTWRPAVAQAGTTNAFGVMVADTGAPVLSATQSFQIFVNPASQPALAQLAVTNGGLQFNVTGQTGPDYGLQVSTNLITWTNVFTTNGPFSWRETNLTASPRRFFRVLIGP